MDRRNFIKLAGSFSLAASFAGRPAVAQGNGSTTLQLDAQVVEAFDELDLLKTAKEMATRPFEMPKLVLPPELSELNQAQYSAIQYDAEKYIWKNETAGYQLQAYHAGFQYKTPVIIHLVETKRNEANVEVKRALRFRNDTSLYKLPPSVPSGEYSISGFGALARLKPEDAQTPIKPEGTQAPSMPEGTQAPQKSDGAQVPPKPESAEEFLVFQGASYFRAIAAGQAFGAYARGVCINTAQASGEEFPAFRNFYIEKPVPGGDRRLVIHALLDGASLTGVFKFYVEPGATTTMEVKCVLFPRKPLTHVGIAPLTSMYYFGGADPTRMDDFRPNMHSSDGLLVQTGNNEWIWRPLVNPERLQYTAFTDRNPKGFGLLQRERDFSAYHDVKGRYENRPSVWVEPLNEWGEGTVDLVELPTRSDIFDNIVAFWHAKAPLQPGTENGYTFHYMLSWCGTCPIAKPAVSPQPPAPQSPPPPKFYVAETRVGAAGKENRAFIIDFVRQSSCNDCTVGPFTADVYAGEGEIVKKEVTENTANGTQRVSFEYRPKGQQADLRCELRQNGQVVSETWIYRWSV